MGRAVKILSVILILIGGLWALQGAGLVGGSFMTGNRQWLYIGFVATLAGVFGLFLSRKQP